MCLNTKALQKFSLHNVLLCQYIILSFVTALRVVINAVEISLSIIWKTLTYFCLLSFVLECCKLPKIDGTIALSVKANKWETAISRRLSLVERTAEWSNEKVWAQKSVEVSVEMAQVGELKNSSQDKWNIPLWGNGDQQTRPQISKLNLLRPLLEISVLLTAKAHQEGHRCSPKRSSYFPRTSVCLLARTLKHSVCTLLSSSSSKLQFRSKRFGTILNET